MPGLTLKDQNKQNALGRTHPATDRSGLQPRITGAAPHRPFASHGQAGDSQPFPINLAVRLQDVHQAEQVPEIRRTVIAVRKGGGEHHIAAVQNGPPDRGRSTWCRKRHRTSHRDRAGPTWRGTDLGRRVPRTGSECVSRRCPATTPDTACNRPSPAAHPLGSPAVPRHSASQPALD